MMESVESEELDQLPCVNDLDTWMLDKFRAAELSNGLAILIGCTNSSKHPDKPLKGVAKDLRTLRQTFRDQLMFTTLCLNDPTIEHIEKVIKLISNLDKDVLALPKTWKHIVVAFSGHGNEHFLFTRDNQLELRKDLVLPLLAIRAEQLAKLPKLFFIDACRGSDKDEGVEIDLSWLKEPGVVSRGGNNMRVSSKGNCYIAYSTMLGYQAFEHPDIGGIWMQILARELTKEENIDKTILDVMTRVNKAMEDVCNEEGIHMQQPITKSTLNVDIKLLHEARALQQLQQSLNRPLSQDDGGDQALQQQLEGCQLQQPQELLQFQHYQYHQSSDVLHQVESQPQPQYLVRPQFQSQEQQPQQYYYHHPYTQQYSAELQHLPQGLQLQPQHLANWEAPLVYCERANTIPESRGAPEPKNEATTEDRHQNHTSLKMEDKDCTSSLKKSQKALSKKTELEDYFKSKGIEDAEISYRTKPESNGYKSTVFCPEVGYAEGETKPTEERAEQSAARKALKQLKQH